MNESLKVLIIEKDVASIFAITKYFDQSFYKLLNAQTEEEGLALAKETHPDVIILDILTSNQEVSGILPKLRADPWGKSARVIVFTNLADDEHKALANNYYVDRYLVKSETSLKDLEEAIKQILTKPTVDIQNLSVGVFFEDMAGFITDCNKKYLSHLGLHHSEVKNTDWKQYVSTEDRKKVFESREKARKESKPYQAKVKIQKNSNSFIWADVKANPVYNNKKELAGYAGTMVDITNHVMSESVFERFRKAVERTENHIVFTDPDGMVVFANEAAEKLTGYTSGEIIGKKAGKLWGGLMEKEVYEKMWKTIKTDKQSYEGELINKRKSGEIYSAEVTITPVLDSKGEVEFFVGLENDITYLKEMEKVKSNFITLASHQLRSPLASIKWLCELLWQQDTSNLTDTQREVITKTQIENEKLIQLVNSLLNVSRIDSKKVNVIPTQTNMSAFLDQVVQDFKPKLLDRKHTLETDIPFELPKLNIDTKLVKEAVDNLLSNAHKYTPEGGRLWIKVKLTDKEFILSVIDNGIGIPLNDQKKIFEKFFRAGNASTSQTYGNGLGLYFVKWVMESHNGKIWFESKENVGTTFYLAFPLK